MIELDLLNHLLDNQDLAAVIDERIYPNIAPSTAVSPFVVFTVVSDTDENSIQGDNYSNNVLFQIDCYASNYEQVKNLKSLAKDAVYSFDYQPFNFNSRDGYESETKLHRQLLEFKINNKKD